jgi:hypothetical protein
MTAFPALINDMTEKIQTFPAYFVIYTQIPTQPRVRKVVSWVRKVVGSGRVLGVCTK